MSTTERELPIPPVEFRRVVGPTDPAAFENPGRTKIYPELDDADFESVFDFGCGCGRVARQLLQQDPRPRSYAGMDLHADMIAWCNENLAPAAPGFSFHHHDVFHQYFNPGEGKPRTLPFPAADASASLVIAHSVFTHILEEDAEHYLGEVSRVLRPGGVAMASFFLFDKELFPMMEAHRNTLYTDPHVLTDAVIFDRTWLRQACERAGLVIAGVRQPEVRGHQWILWLRPAGPDVEPVELVPDEALPRPAAASAPDAAAHAAEAARQRRLAEAAQAEAGDLRRRLAESEQRLAGIEQSRALKAARALRRVLPRKRS
jgi:SAM-dependent methyltransferase